MLVVCHRFYRTKISRIHRSLYLSSKFVYALIDQVNFPIGSLFDPYSSTTHTPSNRFGLLHSRCFESQAQGNPISFLQTPQRHSLSQNTPIQVSFVFETMRLLHTPDQFRFRQTWLENIILLKEKISSGIDF